MCSPDLEFVLTNIICIEKALKGIEIAFVLTGICNNKKIICIEKALKGT